MRLSRLLAFLVVLFAATSAFPQAATLTAGPTQEGHAPNYTQGGFGQPLVRDSGSSSLQGPGGGLSELNITSRPANGITTPPYANSGNGPNYAHKCMWDADSSSVNGQHYLCFDPNALGGGLLEYGAQNGAPALPFHIMVNGVLTTVGGSSTQLPALATPMQYGAAGNGTTDDTAAVQSCLNAVGQSGVCYAAGYRYKVSNLVIPGGSVLSCGFAKPMTTGSGWNTIPAILLAGTGQIYASGPGAAIQDCAVLNSSLTFPLTSRSSYGAGIAITDNGNSDFHMQGLSVVGWDSAIEVHGARPFLNDFTLDGNGSTHAVLAWDVGNTDSGSMGNGELAWGYFFDTFSCSYLAPGTGISVAGTPVGAAAVFMYGKIVSEGFKTADFNFANSAIGHEIWADDFSWTGPGGYNCGYSVGGTNIIIGADVYVQMDIVTASQANQSINIQHGGYFRASELFVELFGPGGGVVVGDSMGAAALDISHLVASGGQGKPIILANASDILHVSNLQMADVNAGANSDGSTPATGAAPYIYNTSNGAISLGKGYTAHVSFENLFSDLGEVNIYGSSGSGLFVISHGASAEIAFIPPTSVACTGIGSTGTCALAYNVYNNMLSGMVTVTPGGTGISTTGQIVLTMPMAGNTYFFCQGTPSGSVGNSAMGATGFGGMTWNSAAPLTSGTQYFFYYSCIYQ